MRKVLFSKNLTFRVTSEGMLDLPEEGDFVGLSGGVDRNGYILVEGGAIGIKHNDIVVMRAMPRSFYRSLQEVLTNEVVRAFYEDMPMVREDMRLDMMVYSRFGFTARVGMGYVFCVYDDYMLVDCDGSMKLPVSSIENIRSLRILVGDEFPYGFVFIDRYHRSTGYAFKSVCQEDIAPMSLSIIKRVMLNEDMGC